MLVVLVSGVRLLPSPRTVKISCCPLARPKNASSAPCACAGTAGAVVGVSVFVGGVVGVWVEVNVGVWIDVLVAVDVDVDVFVGV